MKTYTGGCQCGAVRFEAMVDISKGMSCNCSRCGKLGWILTFIPASQFKLISGADNLTEYLFNTQKIHHQFCKTCGIESFALGVGRDGSETAAFNIRCLDGVDLKETVVTEYNGKDI